MMNPVFLPDGRGNKTTLTTNGPKIRGQASVYAPMVRDATGLTILPKGSRIGPRYEFAYVYRARRAIASLPGDYLVYLLMHCPRCELSFSKGDEYFFETGEADPAECVLDNCIACDGLGEWVYHAPFMPKWKT